MIQKGLALFCLLPMCAFANWQSHLALDLGFGNLSGYSQIPKGGNFETSSLKRPSFSEVGDTEDTFYIVEGGICFKQIFLDINYTNRHPQGTTLLKAPLLTHAQFIPQGATFNMDSHFYLGEFKLGKQFNWHQASVSPFINGNWLRYRYEFNAPPKRSARRFSAFVPGLGLKIEQKISQKWAAEAEVSSTLNLSNLNVYKAEIGLAYALYQQSHFIISPRIKAGFLEIDFQDNQPFPNHVRYKAVPFGSFGLQGEIF